MPNGSDPGRTTRPPCQLPQNRPTDSRRRPAAMSASGRATAVAHGHGSNTVTCGPRHGRRCGRVSPSAATTLAWFRGHLKTRRPPPPTTRRQPRLRLLPRENSVRIVGSVLWSTTGSDTGGQGFASYGRNPRRQTDETCRNSTKRTYSTPMMIAVHPRASGIRRFNSDVSLIRIYTMLNTADMVKKPM